MNSNTTTQGTAGLAQGGAGAFVVLLVWILSIWQIAVPADATIAMTVLVGLSAHYLMVLLSPKNPQVNVPVEQTANPVMVPTVTTPPTTPTA